MNAQCRTGENKIAQIQQKLQSGARTNKYRIIHPKFGEELDILCKSTTMPGRTMGTVEVFLKGRKYQMAGDMSDDGTWSFTIYNTEDFEIRDFFLGQMANIQSAEAPDTIQGTSTATPNLKNTPWYMDTVTIQQLNFEGSVVTEARLYNAFVSNVGPIEYTDEQGEISNTEIELKYTGIEYQGPYGKY